MCFLSLVTRGTVERASLTRTRCFMQHAASGGEELTVKQHGCNIGDTWTHGRHMVHSRQLGTPELKCTYFLGLEQASYWLIQIFSKWETRPLSFYNKFPSWTFLSFRVVLNTATHTHSPCHIYTTH